MARIVAGQFDNFAAAEAAVAALPREDFQHSDYTLFFVTPPGQHAIYPVGGDAHSDEGAKEAGGGAAKGALIGAVAGFLIGGAFYVAYHQAIVVLAGLGLGAYLGSLLGALNKTRDGDPRRATLDHPVEREGGPMVAILAERAESEDRAVAVLQRCGAHHIERTDGKWVAGTWVDFDPRMPSPPDRGVPNESVISNLTTEGDRK